MFESSSSSFFKALNFLNSLLLLAAILGSGQADQHDDYLDDNHSCLRDCTIENEARVCQYEWTLELYSTMRRDFCSNCSIDSLSDCYKKHCVPADGFKRDIEVVNRMLPGPSIQVCEGDTIVIIVQNKLRSKRVSSIHWHGLKQAGTPHMDGVGMISQCPILPDTSFKYKFKANNPGTHYWHSTVGNQRSDGVFGALIVRQSNLNNPQSLLYDFDLKEHVIILNDWRKSTTSDDSNSHYSILINGKGFPSRINQTDDDENNTLLPLAEFNVKQGYRYRFRLINSGCHFQTTFSIDGHNLTVISADGNPLIPVVVDSIVTNAGERYDFVLNADADKGFYYVKVRGDEKTNKIFQRALIKYESSSNGFDLNSMPKLNYVTSNRKGLQLKPFSSPMADDLNFLTVKDLTRADFGQEEESEQMPNQEADRKIFLKINNINSNIQANEQDSQAFSSLQVNDISFKIPDSPILYGDKNYLSGSFCNNETRRDSVCLAGKNHRKHCSCVHMYEFKLNELIEFILVVQEATVSYSAVKFHLHGHHFQVLAVEKLLNENELKLEDVMQMDKNGTLKRDAYLAPLKDSLALPTGGYAVIRFVADNPGVWTAAQSDEIMFVFRVGTDTDLPKEPKGWPKCKSFKGEDDDKDENQNRLFRITGFIYPKENYAGSFGPNWLVDVKISDTSLADAPSITLVQAKIRNPKAFPIPYEIYLDSRKIKQNSIHLINYAISARIFKNNQLKFTNDEFISIIGNNSAILSQINIKVIKIIDTVDDSIPPLPPPSPLSQSRSNRTTNLLNGTIYCKQAAITDSSSMNIEIEIDSVIKLAVVDASLMDVASIKLGEKQINITNETESRIFPLNFSIEYDNTKLKPFGRYSLSIRIEKQTTGKLLFINDEYISIMDHKNKQPLTTVNASVISLSLKKPIIEQPPMNQTTTPIRTIKTISGLIKCKKTASLSANLVLRITISDVSRADAPAVKLAEKVIENPKRFPIKYSIDIDTNKLNVKIGTYAISVSITSKETGHLKYLNDERFLILDNEHLVREKIDLNVIEIIE